MKYVALLVFAFSIPFASAYTLRYVNANGIDTSIVPFYIRGQTTGVIAINGTDVALLMEEVGGREDAPSFTAPSHKFTVTNTIDHAYTTNVYARMAALYGIDTKWVKTTDIGDAVLGSGWDYNKPAWFYGVNRETTMPNSSYMSLVAAGEPISWTAVYYDIYTHLKTLRYYFVDPLPLTNPYSDFDRCYTATTIKDYGSIPESLFEITSQELPIYRTLTHVDGANEIGGQIRYSLSEGTQGYQPNITHHSESAVVYGVFRVRKTNTNWNDETSLINEGLKFTTSEKIVGVKIPNVTSFRFPNHALGENTELIQLIQTVSGMTDDLDCPDPKRNVDGKTIARYVWEYFYNNYDGIYSYGASESFDIILLEIRGIATFDSELY